MFIERAAALTDYHPLFLDDTKLGDTPLFHVKVSPGKHRVRAVAADGRERVLSVEVTPGKHTNLGKLTW